MNIFPFGFYILDSTSPIYVGNDLEAKDFVRAWLEANPEKAQLAVDAIGPFQILTRFLGWDERLRSGSMDATPLLFETSLDGGPGVAERRRYRDYNAALAGHADLVEIARGQFRVAR